jgi:hypothetical protein
MRWLIVTAIGALAILALLGALDPLPPSLGFFLGSLAIVLFPGMAVTRLIGANQIDQEGLPEQLAVWFVVGTGMISAIGFAGLLLKVYLSDLIFVLVASYGVLAAVLTVKGIRHSHTAAGNVSRNLRPIAGTVSLAVILVAIGLALVTLLSPRDYDDWYYLAYIKDFAVGARLASEDAIFGMGDPVTPRIWFGGGWWVLEALLARVSGIDPVASHQVYMPLLVLPFAVLALYTLSRRLFRTAWAALLACGFQVLFYLSSAYPYKSTGWMFFARTAQDKSVACFVVAPVAAALALNMIDPPEDDRGLNRRHLVYLYLAAVLTSVLVHGMGPVWCGLLIVPFALVELLRRRSRASAHALISVALPILVCGLALLAGRGMVRDFIAAPPHEVVQAPRALSGLYLPGASFSLGTDTTSPIVWVFTGGFHILNPLFITRYPFAIAGLALTFALFIYVRSSLTARFLLSVSVPTLLLLFTPAGIALTAWFMTPRLVFRLVWVLPWGLTAAFFVSRLRLRPLAGFLILVALILGLARGNPADYVTLFRGLHERNRPSPGAVDAFGFLASEPSPQGVILASETTGRMIPAFLPDAYPVNFREFGPANQEHLVRLVEKSHIDQAFTQEIETLNVHYILIEKTRPLAEALRQDASGFTFRYENAAYAVWEWGG